MSEMHDAWFFIGVFVFIFLIWIATGGPLHPISFTGPRLSLPGALGGGTYIQLPKATGGSLGGGSNVVLPGSSNGQSVPGSSGTSGGSSAQFLPPSSKVTGVSFTPPSPYRNVVSLSNYVSGASSTDPKNEYVQIHVAQNASAPVNITDWVLQSGATINAEIIPKGTRVPTSGVVNAKDDIILQPGESAYIVTGESPVGASFRENKCTGYFSSFQKFSPSLSNSCPSAPDELTAFYGTPYIHDPSCIDYVNSLPRCKVPVTTSANNLSNTCQDFLDSHMNYNGCLSYHRGDSDFNGNTWHIYLGRDTSMWRKSHEVVELLDDRGKTVAAFTY